MPLPLLFIAVAAATGMVGVGKSIKAAVDSHDANKTNKKANYIIEGAKKGVERARKSCGADLKKLGTTKINILDSSVNHFVKSFGVLKNVNFQHSKGVNEMSKLCLDSADFDDLREMGGFASSILGGVTGGALGGAITAYGAYSAAGYLACASTGTAIAELSGAAATNATLAFFGGGSLATGGLGIAGGTMVLGGLVAGPALAIMGFIVGAKASKAKDEAYSNLAQAKKVSAELMVAIDLCNTISSKCNLFVNLLNKLNKYFIPLIAKMDQAINEHGADFSKFSQEQQQAIAAAASLAKAIKMVLDTPILDKNGNITSDSNKVLELIKPEAIAQGDITYLDKNAKNVSQTKRVVKNKELKVNQIVFACESFVYMRKRWSDEKEECGNIDWNKLKSLVYDSYDIDCTDAEFSRYIRDFGSATSVWLSDLRSDLKRFITAYQISYIVSLYITKQDIILESDVDWPALISSIEKIYGVKIEKWQLFHPGKNTVADVIQRICDKLSQLQDIEENYFTATEFYNKLA
jgi:hypothetical protein